MEKLIEHAIKSAIQLINNPLTNPNKYPEINKQYVPGSIGIIMLISLKRIMNNIPHSLVRVSITWIMHSSNNNKKLKIFSECLLHLKYIYVKNIIKTVINLIFKFKFCIF